MHNYRLFTYFEIENVHLIVTIATGKTRIDVLVP